MRSVLCAMLALALAAGAAPAAGKEGEIELFNGKDTTGWELRNPKITITKFLDASGKEIKGAKKGKVDTKDVVVDAKNKPIEGAKIVKEKDKDVAVDSTGAPIKGAKIVKTGGRDAIVGADGKELKDAKIMTETVENKTGGWMVEKGELICGTGPGGCDLFTKMKFMDCEVHIEFLGTSNSGVYLQGRYEIQVDNSFGVKAKEIEKDGKKFLSLPNTMCGALYSRVAPSKNMALSPKEWQSFDITFKSPRGDKGKITEKGRLTLIWNGEKVIDNAEIDSPTGGSLDGNVGTPGPLMLQGDHGRVSYRNIRIRPLK